MTEGVDSQPAPEWDTDLELVKSIWKDIIARVEDRKRAVDEEIGNYPTPIPHCDAQFNYLLEQRTRLSQQLSRLRPPDEESFVLKGYVELISEFLRQVSDD
jgi:hypothetical protein